MKTSDFYYDLPEELIAQTPVEPRDSSRMLIYDRAKKEISHKHFYDVIDYLQKEIKRRCELPSIHSNKPRTGTKLR